MSFPGVLQSDVTSLGKLSSGTKFHLYPTLPTGFNTRKYFGSSQDVSGNYMVAMGAVNDATAGYDKVTIEVFEFDVPTLSWVKATISNPDSLTIGTNSSSDIIQSGSVVVVSSSNVSISRNSCSIDGDLAACLFTSNTALIRTTDLIVLRRTGTLTWVVHKTEFYPMLSSRYSAAFTNAVDIVNTSTTTPSARIVVGLADYKSTSNVTQPGNAVFYELGGTVSTPTLTQVADFAVDGTSRAEGGVAVGAALTSTHAVVVQSSAHLPTQPTFAFAFVYKLTGSTWAYHQTLVFPITVGSVYQFGADVAITDQTILIGAPTTPNGSITGVGTVVAYDFSGSFYGANILGLYYPQEQIYPQLTPTTNTYFGTSVATYGNKILVGCNGDSVSTQAGSAFLYNQDMTKGIGLRRQFAKRIHEPTLSTGDNYGSCVSLSENFYTISAPFRFNLNADPNAGMIVTGMNNLDYPETLIPFTHQTAAGYTFFGDKLSFDGTSIATNYFSASGNHAVQVYQLVNDSWALVNIYLVTSPVPGAATIYNVTVCGNLVAATNQAGDLIVWSLALGFSASPIATIASAGNIFLASSRSSTYTDIYTGSSSSITRHRFSIGSASLTWSLTSTKNLIISAKSIAVSPDNLVVIGTSAGFQVLDSAFTVTTTVPKPSTSTSFADSLAVYGDWIAVGDKVTANVSGRLGYVFLYQLVGSTWTLMQTIAAPVVSADWGASVSLWDNALVVGTKTALSPSSGLSGCGAVLVYQRLRTSFEPITTLYPSTIDSTTQFGRVVSIVGPTVVISSNDPIYNTQGFYGSLTNAGHVYTQRFAQQLSTLSITTRVTTQGSSAVTHAWTAGTPSSPGLLTGTGSSMDLSTLMGTILWVTESTSASPSTVSKSYPVYVPTCLLTRTSTSADVVVSASYTTTSATVDFTGTPDLCEGMSVSGVGIPSGTVILSLSASTLVLSNTPTSPGSSLVARSLSESFADQTFSMLLTDLGGLNLLDMERFSLFVSSESPSASSATLLPDASYAMSTLDNQIDNFCFLGSYSTTLPDGSHRVSAPYLLDSSNVAACEPTPLLFETDTSSPVANVAGWDLTGVQPKLTVQIVDPQGFPSVDPTYFQAGSLVPTITYTNNGAGLPSIVLATYTVPSTGTLTFTACNRSCKTVPSITYTQPFGAISAVIISPDSCYREVNNATQSATLDISFTGAGLVPAFIEPLYTPTVTVNGVPFTGTVTITGDGADSPNAQTVRVVVSSSTTLPTGLFTVTFGNFVDIAGNIPGCLDANIQVLPYSAPTVTADRSYNCGSDYTLVAIYTDNVGFSASGDFSVTSGSTTITGSPLWIDSLFRTSVLVDYNLSSLGPATHTLTHNLTDAAGNPVLLTSTWTSDIGPPMINFSTPVIGDTTFSATFLDANLPTASSFYVATLVRTFPGGTQSFLLEPTLVSSTLFSRTYSYPIPYTLQGDYVATFASFQDLSCNLPPTSSFSFTVLSFAPQIVVSPFVAEVFDGSSWVLWSTLSCSVVDFSKYSKVRIRVVVDTP